MIKRICETFGVPDTIITDSDPGFIQNAIEFMRRLNITRRKSASYNPRANGKAERGAQSIKKELKRLTPDMTNWSTYMFRAFTSVNAAPLIYGFSL